MTFYVRDDGRRSWGSPGWFSPGFLAWVPWWILITPTKVTETQRGVGFNGKGDEFNFEVAACKVAQARQSANQGKSQDERSMFQSHLSRSSSWNFESRWNIAEIQGNVNNYGADRRKQVYNKEKAPTQHGKKLQRKWHFSQRRTHFKDERGTSSTKHSRQTKAQKRQESLQIWQSGSEC